MLIFVQVHRKLDLKGGFYPRPKKLPVPLGRMAITKKDVKNALQAKKSRKRRDD